MQTRNGTDDTDPPSRQERSLRTGRAVIDTFDDMAHVPSAVRRTGAILLTATLLATACSSSDGDGTDSSGAPDATNPTTQAPDETPAPVDPADESDAADAADAAEDAASDPTTTEAATEESTTTTTEAPVEITNYEITVPPPAGAADAVDIAGQPVEPVSTPASGGEVVELGVEQGVWTREEGVAATLRWLLQDIPVDSIPALSQTRSPSFTDLIEIAEETVTSTDDGEAAEEIQDLLDRIFPPLDVLEAVSVERDSTAGEASPEPQGLMQRAPVAAPSADCIAVNEDAFDQLVAGTNCYAVKTHDSDPVAGYRLRVFYPLEWNGTPKEDVAQLTLDAMVKTTTSIDPFADIGNASLIFSQPRPDGVEGDDLGVATNATNECTVTIFPTVDGSTTEAFKQLIAHETVHCIQFDNMGTSGGDFVDEGGAEYFSHWLYPEGGLEVSHIAEFDQNSLTSPIDTLSYDAWVWWQYLANRSSPQAVWEMQTRISNGSSIEDEADMEAIFHEFVILWSGPGFPNSGSGTVPGFEPRFSSRPTIEDDVTVELPADALVAARWNLEYRKERRFTQTRDGDGRAKLAMAEEAKRTNRGDWTEMEEEIRSTCTEPERFVVVATHVADSHETKLKVEAEEAACDPCLLGTWRLDNASFDALIAWIAKQGGGGDLGGLFTTAGDYFLRFDEEQKWTSWRTGYTITISAQAQGQTFNFVTTIASIERGTYSTNDEQTRLTIPEAVTVDSRATSDFPFGSVTVGQDSASVTMFGQSQTVGVPGTEGPQAAAADYTCDEEVLTVTLDDAGAIGGDAPPVRFDRVEDIPEPPTVLPPA